MKVNKKIMIYLHFQRNGSTLKIDEMVNFFLLLGVGVRSV